MCSVILLVQRFWEHYIPINLAKLLPALFGALFANQIVKKPKLALVALPITGIMVLMNKLQLLSFLPGKLVTPIVMLTCVFGTMGIGLFLASKGKMD